MSTRPGVKPSLLRRGAALTAGVLAAGALATFTGSAGAAPQPTVAQVQKMVNQLTSQMDQAVQQYDQAAQQVASARQRLRLVSQRLKTAQARFQSMRGQIAAIASAAYESGNMTSMGALLTSDNPQAVLSQASVLQQLSADQSARVGQFVSAARGLEGAQQMARRTESGVAAMQKQRLARRNAIGKTLAKQTALLATLTAQQAPATPGSGGGTTTAVYTGPTATQAQKAVAFAYAQLGKPYVWGATGPGSYDCSGLMQAAWASAGVSIPRTTYEQGQGSHRCRCPPCSPVTSLDGDGHVAMYVGQGMIIDAPQPGQVVQKMSLSYSWYASTVNSAARP